MITIQTSPSYGGQRALGAVVKAAVLLFLTSCGSDSSGSKYSVKIIAVNIPCKFAEEIRQGVDANFHEAGIAIVSDLHCVSWPKTYEFGEKLKALFQLKREFGAGHFIVPRFGRFFDGVQIKDSSISVGAEGRLLDSVEQASHEIAHQFGATHDLENCNLMGYRRCGYPAKFNDKAIGEMT